MKKVFIKYVKSEAVLFSFDKESLQELVGLGITAFSVEGDHLTFTYNDKSFKVREGEYVVKYQGEDYIDVMSEADTLKYFDSVS